MAFKKAILSALVVALFVGESVEAVQLQRHGNWSAGKQKNDFDDDSSFVQTSFVTDPEESQESMIDSVYSQMKRSKEISGQMDDNELLQISVKNAKNEISHRTDKALAQTNSKSKVKDVNTLASEIEKVFNFERDVASARVQDPTFDSKVKQIDDYMMSYRKTYKDPDYLRDPLPPFESAARRMDDKAKREFEATKQALDQHKTVYKIKQSEAAAAF